MVVGAGAGALLGAAATDGRDYRYGYDRRYAPDYRGYDRRYGYDDSHVRYGAWDYRR